MKIKALLAILLLVVGCGQASMELTEFPEVREKAGKGAFPLAAAEAATICVDSGDARVVSIAAGLLAEIFSIHTGDFSAEWRWNVLRGYSSRSVDISSLSPGKHKVTVHLLDPGIVLQEIRIK